MSGSSTCDWKSRNAPDSSHVNVARPWNVLPGNIGCAPMVVHSPIRTASAWSLGFACMQLLSSYRSKEAPAPGAHFDKAPLGPRLRAPPKAGPSRRSAPRIRRRGRNARGQSLRAARETSPCASRSKLGRGWLPDHVANAGIEPLVLYDIGLPCEILGVVSPDMADGPVLGLAFDAQGLHERDGRPDVLLDLSDAPAADQLTAPGGVVSWPAPRCVRAPDRQRVECIGMHPA